MVAFLRSVASKELKEKKSEIQMATGKIHLNLNNVPSYTKIEVKIKIYVKKV